MPLVGSALAPTVSVGAGGALTWAAPLLTVFGYDPVRDGGPRTGGDTITVCNETLAAELLCDADTVVGGPHSPLVVYGDTSQDGVWYSGHSFDVLGAEFGPKPYDPFVNIPDAENEDDEWIVLLADPYDYVGNDVINATGLYKWSAHNAPPTVGFRAPVLAQPLLSGTTWASRGGADGDVTSFSQYQGKEQVTVPAFTEPVMAAKVRTDITQAGALGDPYGSGVRTVWWVYGVGPVKVTFEHAGGANAPISQSVLVSTNQQPVMPPPDADYFRLRQGVKTRYRWSNSKHLKKPAVQEFVVAETANQSARVDVKHIFGADQGRGELRIRAAHRRRHEHLGRDPRGVARKVPGAGAAVPAGSNETQREFSVRYGSIDRTLREFELSSEAAEQQLTKLQEAVRMLTELRLRIERLEAGAGRDLALAPARVLPPARGGRERVRRRHEVFAEAPGG